MLAAARLRRADRADVAICGRLPTHRIAHPTRTSRAIVANANTVRIRYAQHHRAAPAWRAGLVAADARTGARALAADAVGAQGGGALCVEHAGLPDLQPAAHRAHQPHRRTPPTIRRSHPRHRWPRRRSRRWRHRSPCRRSRRSPSRRSRRVRLRGRQPVPPLAVPPIPPLAAPPIPLPAPAAPTPATPPEPATADPPFPAPAAPLPATPAIPPPLVPRCPRRPFPADDASTSSPGHPPAPANASRPYPPPPMVPAFWRDQRDGPAGRGDDFYRLPQSLKPGSVGRASRTTGSSHASPSRSDATT